MVRANGARSGICPRRIGTTEVVTRPGTKHLDSLDDFIRATR